MVCQCSIFCICHIKASDVWLNFQGRKLKSTVPNAAFPILLPSVQTELYLNALEKCNFNVFDASLAHGSRSDAMRQLHAQVSIGWYSWQGTY